MTSTINIEELQTKLLERLKPSGWATKLRTFINSDDFEKILRRLAELRDSGKRFTPPLRETFRAFEQCPYSELKVVIIGQDPYPHFGVADGIAFSCSHSEKEQPSLTYMLDQVQKTVYPDQDYERPLDLKVWANQGVLLLNKALTTEFNKIGVHYDIWHDFLVYVIDILNTIHSGLVWIFMGKAARDLESLVGDSHYKFLVDHPNIAYYSQDKSWNSQDVFVKTNQILMENNNTKIIW